MSLTVERLIELLQEQPSHRLVALNGQLALGEVRAADLEDGDMSPVVMIR